ncbi:SRPBCC domain-containing protein [Mucilaginibacter ximonensis]|uniref:SRPBCC domain-containing protein n=1 Tax=Mucilaginibacter ximonensis TaxID=538021 RepID=A0ABW5YA95_9SPHI
MTTTNFTTTLVVDQTPAQVFKAVNSPQNWWWGDIKGNAAKLNDQFEYRYEDMHYSRQEIIEMIADRKVVWLVTDSKLNFIERKDEWTGTKIIFEISKNGDKTQLCFTHAGLQPAVECYDGCTIAWTRLIQQSLHKYITGGVSEKSRLG